MDELCSQQSPRLDPVPVAARAHASEPTCSPPAWSPGGGYPPEVERLVLIANPVASGFTASLHREVVEEEDGDSYTAVGGLPAAVMALCHGGSSTLVASLHAVARPGAQRALLERHLLRLRRDGQDVTPPFVLNRRDSDFHSGFTEDDVLVHDETNRMLANLLGGMEHPEFPVALGVLYCNPEESYDAAVHKQLAEVRDKAPPADLNAMLRRGRTWEVAQG